MQFLRAECAKSQGLRHSRELTRVCSRKLTQRPAFGGGDNAFPTCGVRIKARRFLWVTLSEHKWVILGERRGGIGLHRLAILFLRRTMVALRLREIAQPKVSRAVLGILGNDGVEFCGCVV